MRVYRIEREKYLETTLKGVGATLTEDYRWNSLNTYLVYTAESRALAILEVSVHIDLSEDLPSDRCFVEIDIPDDIEIAALKIDALPQNWDSKPPEFETQYIGDDFVIQNNAAVLKVPSSIVPPEYNYLINPHQVRAGYCTIMHLKNFVYDMRIKVFV